MTRPTSRRALVGGAGIAFGTTLTMARVASPEPDAEVVSTCAHFRVALDRWLRGDGQGNCAPYGSAACTAYTQAMEAVMNTRPTTLEGLRVKAAAIAAEWTPDSRSDAPSDRMLWSIVDDLLEVR
jgi:hypothetical protein